MHIGEFTNAPYWRKADMGAGLGGMASPDPKRTFGSARNSIFGGRIFRQGISDQLVTGGLAHAPMPPPAITTYCRPSLPR